MPSAVISHIIGTGAFLIAFIILTGFFVVALPIPFNNSLMENELDVISEQISLSSSQLVILANSSESSNFLIVKKVDIPRSVSNQIYYLDIRIVDGVLVVYNELTDRQEIHGKSFLPWNPSSSSIKVFNGTLPDGFPEGQVNATLSFSSSKPNFAIWCFKESNSAVTIGLGERLGEE